MPVRPTPALTHTHTHTRKHQNPTLKQTPEPVREDQTLGLVFLPAVDHRGSRSRTSVDVVSDSPDELNERLGGLRDAVIRPDGVVKLPNQPCETQLLFLPHTHTHTQAAVKLFQSPEVCDSEGTVTLQTLNSRMVHSGSTDSDSIWTIRSP